MQNTDIDRYVQAYLLHDVLGNQEGYIADYDKEKLKDAEAAGFVIVAEYNDGSREIVHAADVAKPNPRVMGVSIPSTNYVDERTAATVACFDALAAIVDPQPATADETGEEVAQVDPVEAFKTALDALKALGAEESEA